MMLPMYSLSVAAKLRATRSLAALGEDGLTKRLGFTG